MTDIAAAPSTMDVGKKKTASAAKKTGGAAKKPASAPNHPSYNEMVKQGLVQLKQRGGSSRKALLKYIMDNFQVGKDEKVVNTHLKMALKSGVKNGALKQTKGTGAAGSFRLGDGEKKKPSRAAVGKKKTASPSDKPAATKKAEKSKTESPAKKLSMKKTSSKTASKKSSSPAKRPAKVADKPAKRQQKASAEKKVAKKPTPASAKKTAAAAAGAPKKTSAVGKKTAKTFSAKK